MLTSPKKTGGGERIIFLVPLLPLLDIRTALVWMYFSPIFSFEKEAGIHRKIKRYGPQQALTLFAEEKESDVR